MTAAIRIALGVGALVGAVSGGRASAQTPTAGCVSVIGAPFGARGDGLADDTRVIQQAVDGARCVFLPAGTYRTTRAIVLGAGRRLIGAGRDTTVLHQVVKPEPGSVGNGTTDYDVVRIEGGGVLMSDLTLQGPMTGVPPLLASARGQKGLSVQPPDTASRISLLRLAVVGVQANGISIWNGVSDVYLCDVLVADAGNEGVYVTFGAWGITARRLSVERVRSWAFDTNGGHIGLLDFAIRDTGDSSQVDDGGGVTWTADDASAVRTDVRIVGGTLENVIGSAVNITVPQSEGVEATDAVVADVRIRAGIRSTAPGVFVSTAGGARKGRLRGAWLERLDLENVTLSVQNSTDLFVRDCRVVNRLPLPPGAGPAGQGIRIDSSLPGDRGQIGVTGCRVSGWQIGIMWQAVRSGYAAGNCLAGNTEAADAFAEGVRQRVTRAPDECDVPSAKPVHSPAPFPSSRI